MLSAYYYWRPMYDGYECLQLLEQNGGFGNNGAQPPMQIHNVHNSAGKVYGCNAVCGVGAEGLRRPLVGVRLFIEF